MNDTVKKRLEILESQIRQIANEAKYIDEDLIDSVEESEDLSPIETALENIIMWANNAKEYTRSTYDEFEEE